MSTDGGPTVVVVTIRGSVVVTAVFDFAIVVVGIGEPFAPEVGTVVVGARVATEA